MMFWCAHLSLALFAKEWIFLGRCAERAGIQYPAILCLIAPTKNPRSRAGQRGWETNHRVEYSTVQVTYRTVTTVRYVNQNTKIENHNSHSPSEWRHTTTDAGFVTWQHTVRVRTLAPQKLLCLLSEGCDLGERRDEPGDVISCGKSVVLIFICFLCAFRQTVGRFVSYFERTRPRCFLRGTVIFGEDCFRFRSCIVVSVQCTVWYYSVREYSNNFYQTILRIQIIIKIFEKESVQ